MTDLWESAGVFALFFAGAAVLLLVLAAFLMAARALATWFSSGQWRKDLWR